MERNVVKRWFAGHAAAEQRAFQLMRQEGPPSPDVSFAQAMEICALFPVEPPDEIRVRDDEAARAAWAKVRAWAAGREPRR